MSEWTYQVKRDDEVDGWSLFMYRSDMYDYGFRCPLQKIILTGFFSGPFMWFRSWNSKLSYAVKVLDKRQRDMEEMDTNIRIYNQLQQEILSSKLDEIIGKR